MAGKYILFFVLWFAVACFAKEVISPRRNFNSSMSRALREAPGSEDEASPLVTTNTTATTETPSLPVTKNTTASTERPSPPATSNTTASTERPSPPVTTKNPASTETPSPPATTKNPASTETPSPPATTKNPASTETPSPPATTTKTASTETPSPPATKNTTASTERPSPPATSNTTASTERPSPPVTPDSGPCHINQCGQGSTCAVRADETFVCLCSVGETYNYNVGTCESAKVFPGQLSLPNLQYQADMENKTSPIFKEVAENITDELKSTFSDDPSFSNVTVVSLEKTPESRVGTESASGVTASIDIIFNKDSTITTNDVFEKIKQKASNCSTCLLGNATFNSSSLCEVSPCDDQTSACFSENGSVGCKCHEGYIKTNFSSMMCIACPSGQRAVNSIDCENCNFGYSGFNCEEHWKLVLVIVGSVLGGLLLTALILLPILAWRSPKKSTKKATHKDIGEPYVSHFPAKSLLANGNGNLSNSQPPSFNRSGFEGAGVPRIPRATANSSWDSRTNLEMIPSNSRQNLVPLDRNSRLYDDEDDMNTYTRPQSNQYAPARPQSNPYSQNRPQKNPYAQNQGQSNPYYMPNNDKW